MITTNRSAAGGALDGEVGEVLARVVAAGAAPADRLHAPGAEPGTAGARRRAQEWALAAAGTRALDDPAVRAILATGVLGTENPLAAFADLDPARLDSLPEWAEQLRQLLTLLPERSVGDDELRTPQRTLREAAAELLRRDLDALAARGVRVAVSEDAVADLAAQAAERLGSAAGPSLDFDLRFLRAAEIDGSRGDWCQRLTALPVLGYLMGTALRQWRAGTVEMLVRLAADLPGLRAEFFGGRAPGALAAVRADAGDPHDDGRNVAVLRFESGARAVYKPRDLGCAAAWFALLAQIEDAFPDTPPHRRGLLLGDGYAWEEYVAAAACPDPARLPRYARGMGHLVRLAALLQGRDLWQDNVQPRADVPVLLDLETLAHPVFAGDDGPVGAFLAGTAAPTGLVTAPVLLGPGMPAVDVGGCAPAERKPTPYRPAVPRLAAAGRHLDLSGALLTWTPSSMAWSGTTVLDPRDHVAETEAGYREAEAVLAARAERLLGVGGAAHAFDGTVVRVMWSGTFESYSLLRASAAPQVLTDTGRREAVLARLFRTVPDGPRRAARLAMAAAGVHDLRRLDVPIYRHVVGEDDILTSTGARVSGLLAPRGGWALRDRLRRLAGQPAPSGAAADPAREADPVGAEVAVLRSCQHLVDVHTGRRRAVPPYPAPTGNGEATAARHEAATAEERIVLAADLLDRVWRRALRDPGGRPSWVSLHRDPVLGVTVLGRAGHDLAEGLAGLLVAAAELAAAGADRWLPRARELAEVLAEELNAPAPDRPAPVPAGPFTGPYGVAYALRRTASLLGGSFPCPPERPPGPWPAAEDRWRGTAGARALAVDAAEYAMLRGGPPAGPADPGRPAFWRRAERPGDPPWCAREDLAGLGSDGLLAQGELAAAVLTAGAATADDRAQARRRATEVAAELAARARTVGCLPDRRAAPEHQLSVLDGVPAVVLALLRAAGRGYVSVPVLEPVLEPAPAPGPVRHHGPTRPAAPGAGPAAHPATR